MSFQIMVDSGCNLTDDLLEKYDILAISYVARLDGEEFLCYEKGRDYEAAAKRYYDAMREGHEVATSLINEAMFTEAVEPYLAKGEDVLVITISSGVSGTNRQACLAAESLKDKYKAKLYVADPLGASLGAGMMAIRASELRAKGMSVQDVCKDLEQMRERLYQVFTVEDLSYLKAGGRISALTAAIGSILKVKPILKGNEEGKIVAAGKVLGRRKALHALADAYCERAVDPKEQTLYIAHADCEAEAMAIANEIQERAGYRELVLRQYDLCTGTHVGPGTIAIFFFAEHR